MGASASAQDRPAVPEANQETEEDRIAAAIQRFEARLASLEIKVDRVLSPRGISAPDEVRPADLVPGSSSSAPFETVSEPNEWHADPSLSTIARARQPADALSQPQQTPAALRRLRHPDFKPPVRLADNKWQHKSRGRRRGARNTVADRAAARGHRGSDSTDVIDVADRALAAFTRLESEKHKRTGRRARGGRGGQGGRGGNGGMGGRGRAGGRGHTGAGNRRGYNGGPAASVHDRYNKAVRDLAELRIQDDDDITAEQMLHGLDYWRVDSGTARGDVEPLRRESFGRPLEEREAVARRPTGGVLHPSDRITPYANADAPIVGGVAAGAFGGRWTTNPVKRSQQPDLLSARPGGGQQQQHYQQIVDNVPVRDLGGGQVQLDLTQAPQHHKQAPAASWLNRGMRKPLPPKHHPRQVGGDLHRSRRLNDDGQESLAKPV